MFPIDNDTWYIYTETEIYDMFAKFSSLAALEEENMCMCVICICIVLIFSNNIQSSITKILIYEVRSQFLSDTFGTNSCFDFGSLAGISAFVVRLQVLAGRAGELLPGKPRHVFVLWPSCQGSAGVPAEQSVCQDLHHPAV